MKSIFFSCCQTLIYKAHKKLGDINGFSLEQRFFMSWVTVWRTKSWDEALPTRIKTELHSPGRIRATLP